MMNTLVGMEGQTAPESTHGLFDSPKNVVSICRSHVQDKRRSAELTPRSLNNATQSYSCQKNNLQNHTNELHTVKEEEQLYHTSSSFVQSSFQRKQRASVAHFNSFPGKILIDTAGNSDKPVASPQSREDVLAETIAKLSGKGRHKTATSQNDHLTDMNKFKSNMYTALRTVSSTEPTSKSNRRLSEPFTKAYHYSNGNHNIYQQQQPQQQNPSEPRLFPNSTIHKRMSFQQYSTTSSYNQPSENKRRLSMSRITMADYENYKQRDLIWRSKSPSPSFPAIGGSGGRMAITNPSSRTSSRPNSMVLGFSSSNHRLSTGSSIFQQPNNSSNNSQASQRKALFVSHLPFSAIVPHLKSKQLVSGLLRVNKRNRSDAYVFCEELNADIYICGSRDRNRALEGDFVAVKLTEVEQVLMEKHEKEEAKLVRNNGNPVVRKPDEEDEKEIIFGGEEDVDRVTPKYCGIVVAILERAQNQVFSGTLGLTRPSNKRNKEVEADSRRESGSPRVVWFKPTDKRVPLIAIPIEQAPPGFIENSDAFENRLFLGSIKRWPITSLHPFGMLETELGNTSDPSVQLKAILADNSFTDTAVASSFNASKLSFDILSEEFIHREIAQNSRRDLRNIRCIAVIDDGEGGYAENALSITPRDDGDSFEVGFHVSDVSLFIQPDSGLDKEARIRGVDVYCTAFERIPLWPAVLRDECTDFIEGRDRYAVSVFWKISKTKGILETCLERTVINANTVMSSQDLQRAITAPNNTAEELTQDIKLLYSIASVLKQAHPQEPLQLDTPELEIHFEDSKYPSFVSPRMRFESEVILHEFRTLANTYVAQRISSHFPDHALLQSQARPNDRKLKSLTRYLSSLGYHIQPESPESLQQSIDSIRNQDAKNVILSLILKTMSPEKYFCAGAFDISRYYHYSKNTPLYTHFTSPLKRYADVIVHRQIDAYLNGSQEFYMDTEEVQKIALHCSIRNRLAENAKEQTKHVFLSYYLADNSERSKNRLEDAIVVGVQEDSFDIVVPSLVLERRVHTVNLPLQSAAYNKTENVLHLIWIQGKATVDASVETEVASDEDEDDDDDYHLRDTHSARDEGSQASLSDLNDLSGEDFDNTLMQAKHLSIKSSSTTALDDLKKKRKRSTSIRAINGEDACLTQRNCTFANECRQIIRPFDFIKVVVTAEPVRNPPLIRVLAANPFIARSHN